MPTEAELRVAIEELADEARPLADPAAAAWPSVSHRSNRLVPALAVVAVIAVAGLIVLLAHRSGRHGGAATATHAAASTSTSAPPDCGPDVPAQFCASLLHYAHLQANRSVSQPARDPDAWPDAVTLVSVLQHVGTETQPNVGPPCDSGQLLTVDVIGTFDRVVVAPGPILPGRPTPDYSVDDIVITADAHSGRPCLLSVRTRAAGVAQAPEDATIVYRTR